VGPEVIVGLCVERSLEMIVGILGILKAGGAYLPLDPSYPPERLAYMLEDANIKIALTQDLSGERLPKDKVRCVRLDESLPDGKTNGRVPVSSPTVGADNLVYLIYTSGSTGRPKGVMVTHGGLANYVRYAAHRFGAGSGDGAPICLPLSFDANVTGLFPPLIAGTALWLVPDVDPVENLAALLRSQKNFSLLKLTPSLLEALLPLLPTNERSARIGSLVIGGEPLSLQTVARCKAKLNLEQIFNHYGPTETVVGSAVCEVRNLPASSTYVPIGAPICNARLYVLDKQLEPASLGVPGELYIGGQGVARGYLNRASLTAERFVPDPFGPEGSRLYRTGDLVRHLPYGGLEFIARMDQQIKIRGFRIEPGEIEATLLCHPDITGATVVAREVSPHDTRLIAYVVAPSLSAQQAKDSQLRQYLRNTLPEYMLPSAFVFLDELPLTVNGKVDKRSLPPPTVQRESEKYVQPRVPIEQTLALIWEDVLKVGRIGIHDSFFELGGHSLLATRVVSRVRDILGMPLSLRTLFEHPTIDGVIGATKDWNIDPLRLAAIIRLQSHLDETGRGIIGERE
jgi:amino acid adenylation domain-containing protein